MSEQWYLARNRKQFGPYTSTQLRQLAQTGRLQPNDLVCSGTGQQWRPAYQVRGLFAQAPSPSRGAARRQTSGRGKWIAIAAAVAFVLIGGAVAFGLLIVPSGAGAGKTLVAEAKTNKATTPVPPLPPTKPKPPRTERKKEPVPELQPPVEPTPAPQPPKPTPKPTPEPPKPTPPPPTPPKPTPPKPVPAPPPKPPMSKATDWLQFRGPGGIGIAQAKNLPASWSPQSNVIWKSPLPGHGTSSPIVVGNKVFLTSYTGYGLDARNPGNPQALKRHLICLDRAGGKTVWSQEIPAVLPDQRFNGPFITLHGYASSTPASDGQRVYVFAGKSGVSAFDLNGKRLWTTSVGNRTHGWGSATSPVLFGDLVIVNASVESGSLVALRKATGQMAWTARNIRSSWSTPLLVQVGNRQELVLSIQGRIRAYNPATGQELWNCEGVNDYVCPSVTAHDGVIFAIGGRSNTAIAVRAGGNGDVSGTHTLWRIKRGSNVSSPVYHDGHLYWASEQRGVVYCAAAEKGTVVFEQRLNPNPGRIYASPLAADGKLYFVSRERGTYVIDAAPKFNLIARNSLDSTIFNASPVAHQGQLLLRSDEALYCIGNNQ